MRRVRFGVAVGITGVLASTGVLTQADPPAGGTVCGRVRLQGGAPACAPIPIESAEHRTSCGRADVPNETLLVSADGGVRNAVVTLEAKEGETPAPAAIEACLFDQQGCLFLHHVMVIPVGSTVRFKNSDNTAHNVRTNSRRNPAFNETIPANGEITKTFERAERIEVTCTIHPFMSAWLVVVDTPYWAVTGEDGSYSIANVPAGTYKIRVWHESRDYDRSGPGEVTVAAGAGATADYSLVKKN
ncbi:MAG: hypothetical protein HY608_01880 [Planctomycetes bacterium]|nr:hypothetical protein [Planctomycetota bacterium]